MLTCTSGPTLNMFPKNEMSLQQCGAEEAQKFKWILSEREGRDLGDHAIKQWVLQHWNGFLRHHWLEHLQGKTLWVELQRKDFGILLREFQNSPLLDPILDRLKVLKENLDIILWAQDVFTQQEMEEALCILEALDVNACRLQCEFDPRRRG